MPEASRRPYKTATPETWALIRAAYQAGHPAPVLARHFGVNPGAIYRKACYEGWTKLSAARAEAPPLEGEPAPERPDLPPLPPVAHAPAPPPPPEREPAPRIDPARPAESALEGATRLMQEGRTSEATAYLRFAQAAERVEARAAKQPSVPSIEETDVVCSLLARITKGDPEAFEQGRMFLLEMMDDRGRCRLDRKIQRDNPDFPPCRLWPQCRCTAKAIATAESDEVQVSRGNFWPLHGAEGPKLRARLFGGRGGG